MSRDDYFSIDTIRDGGCVAQINAKARANGRLAYSFALFREFERDDVGPTVKTYFFGEVHFEAVRRLVDAAERRIQEAREQEFADRRKQRGA